MSRSAASMAVVLVVLAVRAADAQVIEVAGYGVAATNSEVGRERQAKGLGVGAEVRVRSGRLHFTARGMTTSLRADFSVQPDYALDRLEIVAAYEWWRRLSFLAGAARSFVRPGFQAQEVGTIRLGLRSDSPLTSLAHVHAAASYLPVTRFSGGGGSDLAIELELGLRVGPPTGRVSGLLEYTYQRIDREVTRHAAPIRFSTGRLGVAVRL